MNDRFDELMYRAGITAQGCWDEMDGYDRDAILNFAELIVRQMLEITDAHTEVFQTDRDRAVIEHIKQSVKTHFGVEE